MGSLQVIDKNKNEIKDVYKSKKVSRIEEEVDDLLFLAVNLGRLLSIDYEEALEKTVSKFVEKFSFIKAFAISKNKN